MWGDVVKGFEEDVVLFEGAETADDSDAGGVGGEAEGEASEGGVGWGEEGGVDAIGDHGDFFWGEAELEEFGLHGAGNRVDGARGAVEPAALAESVGEEIGWGELAMFAVGDGGDGAGDGGEGGVDEGAEVVGMDEVGAEFEDEFGEASDGERGEAVVFAEERDAMGVGEAIGESASAFEASEVDFEVEGFEGVRHIDHSIFHSTGIEGIDDVKNFQGVGVVKGWAIWGEESERRRGGERGGVRRRDLGGEKRGKEGKS